MNSHHSEWEHQSLGQIILQAKRLVVVLNALRLSLTSIDFCYSMCAISLKRLLLMSKRTLVQDAGESRKVEYEAISQAESQEALWEALDSLSAEGLSLGVKAEAVLAKRQAIKIARPK